MSDPFCRHSPVKLTFHGIFVNLMGEVSVGSTVVIKNDARKRQREKVF